MTKIYILKNKINNKWYIGKTNRDLETRFREHINDYMGRFDPSRKLHLSMRKYGVENFSIELYKESSDKSWREDEVEAIIEMGGYLSKNSMNSSPGGEGYSSGEQNPHSLLSNKEVAEIRRRRFEGERKNIVFLDFDEKISLSGFENIWLGNGYPEAGQEYLLDMSKSELISKSNRGSRNGRANLNEKIVMEIRKRKKKGDEKSDVYFDYSYIPHSTFNKVWNYYTWKHVIPN